ncbi:SurA N-terminal domain-containing protein [Desulfovibrio sp. OttesenSCG-928-A18]|nr:SurA N-terminal domain-containing protein [Desulfovibrio sp. OttesenSCG-928-A18]
MLDNIRSSARSFGIKLIFGMIIIVFIFWGVGNFSASSGGALAVVNGEAVYLSDFEKMYNRMVEIERKNNPELFNNAEALRIFKYQVLDEAVNAILRRQAAERMGILVTPHEIRAVIAEFPVFHDKNGRFDPELYRQLMQAQGTDMGVFEAGFVEEIRNAKLVRLLLSGAGISTVEARNIFNFSMERRSVDYVLFSAQEYAERAEISDAQISEYYENNKTSFQTPAMTDVEYLLLTPQLLADNYPVSDEEALAFYEKNKERYHFKDRFLSRHIFIFSPEDGSSEEGAAAMIAEARAQIEGVEAQLKAGADFAELAKLYSQDMESKDQGGLVGWLDMGQTGTPEYDAAAFAMSPGETSGIVRTSKGFHIIRLEDKKNEETQPFETTKADIVKELARGKAEMDFGSIQKAAQEGLDLNKPFAELAAEFHVELRRTGLVPVSEAEKTLKLHSGSRQFFMDAVVVKGQGPSSIPVPLDVTDGIALVRIEERRSAGYLPLEQVRDTILQSLRAGKGRELAKAAADAALPLFTGKDSPAAFADKVQTSREAVRAFAQILPLGQVPELAEDLFAASGSVWLPKVYAVDGGYVIARVGAITPVDDAYWNEFKGIFLPQLGKGRELEVLAAFVQNVAATAKVERYYSRVDAIQLR